MRGRANTGVASMPKGMALNGTEGGKASMSPRASARSAEIPPGPTLRERSTSKSTRAGGSDLTRAVVPAQQSRQLVLLHGLRPATRRIDARNPRGGGQELPRETPWRFGIAPRDLPSCPRRRRAAHDQRARAGADVNRPRSQAGLGQRQTIRRRRDGNDTSAGSGFSSRFSGMRKTNWSDLAPNHGRVAVVQDRLFAVGDGRDVNAVGRPLIHGHRGHRQLAHLERDRQPRADLHLGLWRKSSVPGAVDHFPVEQGGPLGQGEIQKGSVAALPDRPGVGLDRAPDLDHGKRACNAHIDLVDRRLRTLGCGK
jgi:hypothetical protein